MLVAFGIVVEESCMVREEVVVDPDWKLVVKL